MDPEKLESPSTQTPNIKLGERTTETVMSECLSWPGLITYADLYSLESNTGQGPEDWALEPLDLYLLLFLLQLH